LKIDKPIHHEYGTDEYWKNEEKRIEEQQIAAFVEQQNMEEWG
jgi:hypothetical protein